MSEYFFLTNVGSDIKNIVEITSSQSNVVGTKKTSINFKIGIYKQGFEDNYWVKLDERYVNEDFVRLCSDEYPINLGELAVLVMVANDENLEDVYEELPEPISRKIVDTKVNDRASVIFCNKENCSSYQGEFPYLMSKIKGTFLSFDPLVQFGNEVQNKLFFVNIYSKKIKHKKKYSLCMAENKSKKILNCINYYQNSVAIMDIKKQDNEVIFYSKDTLGIPIFLSFNDKGFISVEHTHPPSEFFWKEKLRGQGFLKSNWLENLK